MTYVFKKATFSKTGVYIYISIDENSLDPTSYPLAFRLAQMSKQRGTGNEVADWSSVVI